MPLPAPRSPPQALSIVCGDLCTSDWGGFPPAPGNQRLPQKKGIRGGFLAFLANTWNLLCARYWYLLSVEPPTSLRNWRTENENYVSQSPQPARGLQGTRLPYFQPCSYPQRCNSWERVPHSPIWRDSCCPTDPGSRYFGEWGGFPKCFSSELNSNTKKKKKKNVPRDKIGLEKYRVQLE